MLANRYEILEEIGSGGMGSVYRALDTQSDTLVAIKQLKPQIVHMNPELIARFQRESEILQQLNHPNIVNWLDTISHNNNHYIVMEYIHGGDLQEILHEGVPPIQRSLEIALDIADALTRTHRLNIVHRDLKPANVLLAEDGTPRLTDFGLARTNHQTADLTQRGAILGTLYYLPPEIISGQEVNHLADIWSFGVMLFQMLTGSLPFIGENKASILRAILADPVPDIEYLHPHISPALADLIYRMLTRDLAQRLPSVRLVGFELEAILHNSPPQLHTRPTSAIYTDTPTLILSNRFSESPHTPALPHHNLPHNITPFVGRQLELNQVTEQLNAQRLVTILAAGGMGKTRLALEIGRQQLPHWEDGVFFVDLAALDTGEAVGVKIIEAIGLNLQSRVGSEVQENLLSYIQDKNILLILDNFEHVLDGAYWVSALLDSAPHTKIMITSRSRLNLKLEQVVNLSGMPLPPSDVQFNEWAEYSILQLFTQSARHALPAFEVDKDNLADIVALCCQVQAMPLAVVLAAGWITMLDPAEIRHEIEQSIDFLEVDTADRVERHRSIRAVFDYSWDLLTQDEQDCFKQLTVFRGGFTRHAAQAVTGANLRTLLGLLDKSLLQRTPAGRFGVHMLLREYGAEHLAQNPADYQATCLNHATYYANFIAQHTPALTQDIQRQALQEIDAEIDNIMVALNMLIQQESATDLVDVVAGLTRAFITLGYDEQLNNLLQAIIHTFEPLALQSDASPDRRRLVARTYYHASDYGLAGRRAYLERSLEFYTDITSPDSTQVLCLLDYGVFASQIAHIDQAATLANELDDEWLQAIVQQSLGVYAGTRANNQAQAAHHLAKALASLETLGDWRGMTDCLINMTIVADHFAAYADILDYSERGYVVALEIGDRQRLADFSNNRAYALCQMGEYAQALPDAQKGVELYRNFRLSSPYRNTLDTLATIHYMLGNYDMAQALYEECLEIGHQLPHHNQMIPFHTKQLAFVILAQGQPEQASRMLLAILREVLDNEQEHRTLIDTLVGLALVMQADNPTLARQILSYTQQYSVAGKHIEDESNLWASLQGQHATPDTTPMTQEDLINAIFAQFGEMPSC